MCRLCFEPVAVRYHFVSSKNASEIEVDAQSKKLCGPKKYVPCEDYMCMVCTTEAVAQRRKTRMEAIRGESAEDKRERNRLCGRYGNAGVRAWRFG